MHFWLITCFMILISNTVSVYQINLLRWVPVQSHLLIPMTLWRSPLTISYILGYWQLSSFSLTLSATKGQRQCKPVLQLWSGKGTPLEAGAASGKFWRERHPDLLGSQPWLIGKSGYSWSWGVVGDGLSAVLSNTAPLPERAVTAEFCSVPLRECSSRAVHFFSSAQLLAKDVTSASLC